MAIPDASLMVVDSVELFGERIVVVVTPSMATPANGNDTLGPVFTPGWGVKQRMKILRPHNSPIYDEC